MRHLIPRRRLFIDRPVQGALIARVLLYFGASLMAQVLLMAFFDLISSAPDDLYGRGEPLRHLQFAAVASALLLPLIVIDVVRLSHRWVGPVFRLRASLHALSRNDHVPLIRFREGDFWQELAGDFNVVAAELNRRRAADLAPSTEGPKNQGLDA